VEFEKKCLPRSI